MSRRVVITGMGVISPVGVGLNRYWDNLKSGYSGIVPVTKFDTSDCPVKIGGEVPSDFNPEDFLDKKEIKRLDNFSIWRFTRPRIFFSTCRTPSSPSMKANTIS
ncbi:MAG TPA: beta-ketoacyl-[acyl-carrier-protein] synthase II, partial [Candidatus Marinimicrobia bacterium]|nr:beta-ketoacyl-[acyl-carrier-protein] synthase II [Candidatus Neomarinimicrobiota bacterium]